MGEKKYLTAGTTRIIYDIGDGKVLKKGKPEPNFNEWNLYMNHQNFNILPIVYEHSDDFSWIISERVKPIRFNEFEEYIGMPFKDGLERFIDFCQGWTSGDNIPIEGEIEKYIELIKNDRFFYELAILIDEGLYDLQPSNFGVRNDNTVVVLDTGSVAHNYI